MSKKNASVKKTGKKMLTPKSGAIKKARSEVAPISPTIDGVMTGSSGGDMSANTTGSIFRPMKIITFFAWLLIMVFSFIGVDFLVQYMNNNYSIAVVNGVRISRNEYEQRLEDAYGESVAQQLIDEQLVLAEGEKKKLDLSEDVDRIREETIDQLGGEDNYKKELEKAGITDDKYKRNLEITLIAQRLAVPEPTDDDLKAFFEQYKASYFEETDTFEGSKEKIKEAYYSQNFNTYKEEWLLNLRSQAKIQNNVTDKPKYGVLKLTGKIIKNLTK